MRRMLGVLRRGAGAGRRGRHGLAGANGTSRSPARAAAGAARARCAGRAGARHRPRRLGIERAGRPFELSSAAGLTVYRIVQEALTNVLKHADEPGSVEVRLAFDDPDLSVRVTDDGRATVPVPAAVRAAAVTARERWRGRQRERAAGHGRWPRAGRHGGAGHRLRRARSGPGPPRGGGWEVEAMLRDCKAPAPA